MLYIGAVEGSGRLLAPKHVYRMTNPQAAKAESGARERYGREANAVRGARWYQDNSREAVRDETLREGLVPAGAVAVRADPPTTSSKPRYALRKDFAGLFNPALDGSALERAIGVELVCLVRVRARPGPHPARRSCKPFSARRVDRGSHSSAVGGTRP